MPETLPDILTPKEAADYLRLTKSALLEKTRQGLIPAAKIGREWRFSRRQLLQWLEDAAIPEELVEQGMVLVAEERAAEAQEGDFLPWPEAKKALSL